MYCKKERREMRRKRREDKIEKSGEMKKRKQR